LPFKGWYKGIKDFKSGFQMKNNFTFSALFLLISTLSFSQIKQFRSNLYIVSPDGTPVLMDGTLSLYHDDYSNEVDYSDARKMTNPGENFGILRGGKVLIVERRKDLTIADTNFYKIWNTRVITYRLEFLSKDISGDQVTATLYDKYLDTSVSLSFSEKNYYDFSVTKDVASKRSDRFMVVFNPAPQIDNSTSSIDYLNPDVKSEVSQIQPAWVSDSPQGQHAQPETMEEEANSSNPLSGYQTRITLYPNPSQGQNIRMKFEGQQAGKYNISLMTNTGYILHSQTTLLNSGSNEIKLLISKPIQPGIYRVEILGPRGYRSTKSLLITK
jgi:hypothetical protein